MTFLCMYVNYQCKIWLYIFILTNKCKYLNISLSIASMYASFQYFSSRVTEAILFLHHPNLFSRNNQYWTTSVHLFAQVHYVNLNWAWTETLLHFSFSFNCSSIACSKWYACSSFKWLKCTKNDRCETPASNNGFNRQNQPIYKAYTRYWKHQSNILIRSAWHWYSTYYKATTHEML